MFYSEYAETNACPAFDENYVEPHFDPSIMAFRGIIYAGVASALLWLGILLLLKWLI
jgi:hypothetical protein